MASVPRSLQCHRLGLGHKFSVKPHTPPLANSLVCIRANTSHIRRFTSCPPNYQRIVKASKSSWPHPVYTKEQMEAIEIAHRSTRNFSDRLALSAVRLLRTTFDRATGYKHDIGSKHENDGTTKAPVMTSDQWLSRFIFLESIAAVPGMAAATLRHLHSLRNLRRDNGWIETLIEEAYNERMHLLTFLQLRKPGWFMRVCILGAQGVFFNAFFIAYLLSPRVCHRFVGYLEEEAVCTYTRAIADLESGKIPEWNNMKASKLAIRYFNLSPDALMLDVLQHIRADEAKHREVNHTLANLHQTEDPNPYTATYSNPEAPRPTKCLKHVKGTGYEREELFAPAADAREVETYPADAFPSGERLPALAKA